jgi:hypothetical protein
MSPEPDLAVTTACTLEIAKRHPAEVEGLAVKPTSEMNPPAAISTHPAMP